MDSKDFGPVEFLQRLAQHVLPRGFHRVREYGFLAPAAKKKLFLMQNLLEVKIPNDPPPKLPALRCSLCQGIMLPIGRVISEGRLKQESLVSVGARSPPIVSIS
ncbi:transposase [Lentisphaera araneosa HTCC2155]|uniref:Transposase n=4 Tax=Lentisphaera araneosa HTCC2155 TaxID=313628 RepID=A6DI22_9BACT|nr:transposase [Lentisphaera araneosa HTCC2155]